MVQLWKMQREICGEGNITGDPVLIDPAVGNYCIDSCSSPCDNVGIDALYLINYGWCYSPDHDIRNLPRPLPASTSPDMGAYEVDWCVGIDDSRSAISDFRITNYPNPFTSSTTIEFELDEPELCEITICNQFGQMVDSMVVNGQQGTNQVNWDARALPVGIYVCRITVNCKYGTKKLVLVR